MKFKDLILMALRNLNARRLRTFLTVLGVVIGATAIILMLSIGLGFKEVNTQMFRSMGDLTSLDLRTDMVWSDETAENSKKDKKKLDDAAVTEIKKLPHVKAVIPVFNGNVSIKSGRYEAWASLVAIPADLTADYGLELQSGRFLNSQDKQAGIIVGDKVQQQFSDPKRNASKEIDLTKTTAYMTNISLNRNNKDGMDGKYNYDDTSYAGDDMEQKPDYSEKMKVVGVLKPSSNWDLSNSIFISMDYLDKIQKDMEKLGLVKPLKRSTLQYDNIKVKVDDFSNVDAVQAKIKSMGYNATNMFGDFLKQSNQQLLVIQVIFGAIGGIAFLVAAIGITNTMIMSIYERTREIGVMKVIGASISDIQKLFLVESGFIGFFGGLIGLIISKLLSILANFIGRGFLLNQMGDLSLNFDPKISIIPFWLIILSLGFSTFIGVIAGYMPARRAMKLSALDAIRTE